SEAGLVLAADCGRVTTNSGVWSRQARLSLLIGNPVVPIISPRRTPGRFELAASLRRFYFLKAELLVELIVRLTVDLDIRVDEVIESWTILLRGQADVAGGGKLLPVGGNHGQGISFVKHSF